MYADASGLPVGTLVEFHAVTVDAAGHGSTRLAYGTVVTPPVTGDLLVTVPGNHDGEMGCPGNWQPDCAKAKLAKPPGRHLLRHPDLPAGSYKYKVAIGGSLGRVVRRPDGRQRGVHRRGGRSRDVLLRPSTHWFAWTAHGPILTVPRLDNKELGCDNMDAELLKVAGNPDGDGTFTFVTKAASPAGSCESEVAHDLSWTRSYRRRGTPVGRTSRARHRAASR